MLELVWILGLDVSVDMLYLLVWWINFIQLAFFSLSDIGCFDLSLLNNQGWFNADLIGLSYQNEITCWNEYVGLLKSSHVRLSNEKDILVWNQSKFGKYTPRAGYLQLMLER